MIIIVRGRTAALYAGGIGMVIGVGHLCRPLESAELRKILGWEDFEL
jgi:hypothetical protein